MSPDSRVPATHPIRTIRALADAKLAELSPVFDEMYSSMGRPSIPPERLLKGCLLIVLYSVRSERQFCERLDYDLMFRFFATRRTNRRPIPNPSCTERAMARRPASRTRPMC